MTTNEPVLRISGLSIAFRTGRELTTAVNDVSIDVAAGETVAIVEVMKLMSHVSAPVAGVVTAIMVENGATVEYGEPLITIDPEG